MPHETTTRDPDFAVPALSSSTLHVTTIVKDLKDAVALLKRVTATKSCWRALACIYLVAKEGSSQMVLRATDCQTYIQMSVPARTSHAGIIAVEAPDLCQKQSEKG